MEDQVINTFILIDDFCKHFELDHTFYGLPGKSLKPRRKPEMYLSEMLTITIHFHQSGFREFKDYYLDIVSGFLRSYFPRLVSYTRFLRLMERLFLPLVLFQISHQLGRCTGASFIDSTTLAVCDNKRIHSHRVFSGIAARGKTSMGWFYGFKLHLVINNHGEILAWMLTPGNVADNDLQLCKRLSKGLHGLLFGDRGYISQKLLEELLEQNLKLVTKIKRNMKNKLVLPHEKYMLYKRAIIESVNDQLKNISQIEHTRHRSPANFLTNLAAGLVAYTIQPQKPSVFVDKLRIVS